MAQSTESSMKSDPPCRSKGFWKSLLSIGSSGAESSTEKGPSAADWDYLKWAEEAAIENLRGRIANADSLRQESNTLLTLLLAGIGGALAYAFKSFDAGVVTAAACGAAGVAIWLMIVAAILMNTCVLTKPMPTLFNEPKNIYRPDLKLTESEVRGYELDNLQGRIDQAKTRNRNLAWWLDRCRLAAIATPFIFVAVTWGAADRLDGKVHDRDGRAPAAERDLLHGRSS